MHSLSIKNSVAEMAALEPFVEELSEEYGIEMSVSFNLQLALDEALTNIVNYAYGEAEDMPITIQADVEETAGQRRIIFRLTDEGAPFNPLEEAPEVDTTLSAEERQIGGLGIFLIRQTMDELDYTRQDGKNIFTLIKNI